MQWASVRAAAGGPLLYAAHFSRVTRKFGVTIFSYPGGKMQGQVTGLPSGFGPRRLCTDTAGDVFVAGTLNQSSRNYGAIYEFSHGGTSPIAMLTDEYVPFGCSVDPTTGTLAVSNLDGSQSSYGSVAFYQNASGKPKYVNSNIRDYFGPCAYDDAGNLFVSEAGMDKLAELPKGSKQFQELHISNGAYLESLQWYGGKLVASYSPPRSGPVNVYRLEIEKTVAKVVGTTRLTDTGRIGTTDGQFWVDGTHITGSGHGTKGLLLWDYPKGGFYVKALDPIQDWPAMAVSD